MLPARRHVSGEQFVGCGADRGRLRTARPWPRDAKPVQSAAAPIAVDGVHGKKQPLLGNRQQISHVFTAQL